MSGNAWKHRSTIQRNQGSQIKEQIMKRFLIMAAVLGGLTFAGFGSTASAGYWGPGYGRCGYTYRGWGRPYGFYGVQPYVAPSVFIGGPRIGIGIGTPYAYPAGYPVYGYGYPYAY
jgi:hypothetical protein